MSRIVRFMLITTLAVLAVAPLNAQTPTPFDAWHSDLSRVVDLHVEWSRQDALRPASAAQSQLAPLEANRTPRFRSIVAHITPTRIAAAQRRLLALGVDAARIFAEEGVPRDLIVIAGVESNYDPLALSPKGARGLWQLMPETAKRFGLSVEERTDDRIHPVHSTRAAALYLHELYLQFGDWTLALAAYNTGESRVAAAMKAADSRDFWQISGLGLLPSETRQYVPVVLGHSTRLN